MWTYTYHRFDTLAAALSACDAIGLDRGEDGVPVPAEGMAMDMVGELPGAVGWHLNMAWYDCEVPEPFVASQIAPITPRRVFAGAPV